MASRPPPPLLRLRADRRALVTPRRPPGTGPNIREPGPFASSVALRRPVGKSSPEGRNILQRLSLALGPDDSVRLAAATPAGMHGPDDDARTITVDMESVALTVHATPAQVWRLIKALNAGMKRVKRRKPFHRRGWQPEE